MTITLDRELMPDGIPTPEILEYCIKQHQGTLARLNKLSDYYDGKQDISNRTFGNPNIPNHKIVANHAKYIVDIATGFLVGNPIAYSGSQVDKILDEYSRMDIVSHDTELEKDLSVFGIGYELMYLAPIDEGDTEIRIKSIDPRGIFVVTDDTVDKNPLFGVHYQQRFKLDGSLNYYLINVYTADKIFTYHAKGLSKGQMTLFEESEHYFGAVPVVEYRNNEERQGDFEQQISQFDAYNLLQSDRINESEQRVNSILFIKGFTLGEDNLTHDSIIETTEKDSDLKWLIKEIKEADNEVLRQSLLDDIHKFSYIPSMTDEHFAGNVSGEAMKYKLFGLLQLLSIKTRYMSKSLRKRLELMRNILNTKGSNIDISDVKITFKPNLPINTNDLASIINQLKGILPLETLIGWLPDIDDPAEQLQKLEEEQSKSIQNQQQALGNGTLPKFDEVEADEEG
jgi:phage portal protein, SPP1 family|nr:MAG TPA: PORTAL PROTEIN [Caudoviricetes sp.]